MLTDQACQPLLLRWRSPLLRCLLSAFGVLIILLGAGRNKPPHAPVPAGQKFSVLPQVADEGRCVGRCVGFFCTKPAAMSTQGKGHQLCWERQTSGKGMGTET